MRRSWMTLGALAAVTTLLVVGGATATEEPRAAASVGATCADHPNQVSVQRARDTRDADGDGIYCVIYSR